MAFPNPNNDKGLNHWLQERLEVWSAADHSEEASLKGIMATKQEAIVYIDSQMMELQAQMDALKQQRDMLELQRTKCQSLFSPIRRLPPDLLIEIFRHLDFRADLCVGRIPSYGLSGSRASWRRHDATRVSTVCRSWNTLLCSVRQFWNNLRIEIQTLDPVVLHPEMLFTIQTALSHALERSAPATLTIDISDFHGWPYINDILSPILREAHRWKELFLSVPLDRIADAGLCGLGCLASLESLTLRDTRADGEEITVGAFHWFSDAPRLRNVMFLGTRLGLFNLPWAQLNALVIENDASASSVEDVEILALATSLRSLELYGNSVETPRGTSRKVVLPITLLRVAFQEDVDLIENSFELPFLTDLRIDNTWSSPSSFLAYVAPTLERLTLPMCEVEPLPLFSLGSDIYFPKLVELSVRSWEDLNNGQDVQAGPEHFESLRLRFPRLVRFECDLDGAVLTDSSVQAWGSIVSQIAHRPGEATQTCLRLHGPVSEQSPVIPMFRDLISKGTVIEIRLRSYYSYIPWRLDASDVESADLFKQRQNARLRIAATAKA